MFIRAKSKALISKDILVGWKNAGLKLLQPQKMLQELFSRQISIILLPFTPQNSSTLNLSLLDNSPPDSTELRNVNQTFNSVLQKSTDLFTLIKCYDEQITCVYEMAHNNITIMHKKLKQKNKIFNARKKRKKEKKIVVEKKFVFTTKKMLELMEETKAETAVKKTHKQPRKRSIQEILENEKNEILKDENNSSDSDCIVPKPRK